MPPNASKDSFSKGPVLLITGMSGSGRSFALKALENMGYETIDNLPLTFLEPVVSTYNKVFHPLAISIDVRTRDFSSDKFLKELEKLTKDPSINAQLIFFDCDDEILVRRYNESRHIHPLAHERPVVDGIRLERQLMSVIKEHAHHVIDTSITSTFELMGHLRRLFLLKKGLGLSVFITSFSFRHGLPREADMVFDARLLKNPFYIDELRTLSGKDQKVADFIKKDKVFSSFFHSLKSIVSSSLPCFEEQGRGYLTVAVGCTGGQHRSVYIATMLAEWLQTTKNQVKLQHRDLKKGNKI
ncbi:MAG: RNase adapter RapZ [Alphaproteobacteria bacterium]|nr:RNase adapter RapZ [Alphaproteobacteria bacterium]